MTRVSASTPRQPGWQRHGADLLSKPNRPGAVNSIRTTSRPRGQVHRPDASTREVATELVHEDSHLLYLAGRGGTSLAIGQHQVSATERDTEAGTRATIAERHDGDRPLRRHLAQRQQEPRINLATPELPADGRRPRDLQIQLQKRGPGRLLHQRSRRWRSSRWPSRGRPSGLPLFICHLSPYEGRIPSYGESLRKSALPIIGRRERADLTSWGYQQIPSSGLLVMDWADWRDHKRPSPLCRCPSILSFQASPGRYIRTRARNLTRLNLSAIRSNTRPNPAVTRWSTMQPFLATCYGYLGCI